MKQSIIPRVFPIVIHYGSMDVTKKLVAQLKSGTLFPADIIVVDNSANNAGYAGGVNRGLGMLMPQVKPDDIVIALNNDVVVSPKSLQVVQNWWSQNPAPVLAGIKMGYVNLITGRTSFQKNYKLPTISYQLPYLHGACLIAPFKIFLALQGLPNQYFMYWEDVVLSQRARQVGLPLKVIPNTGLAHDDTHRTLSDDQLYYLVRNGASFLARYSPRPWRYYWRAINPLRFFYHRLRSHHPVAQALRDALRSKLGPRV